MKPFVFLDVDGVLNPYAAKPNRRPEGYSTFYLTADNVALSKKQRRSDIRVWINAAHGAHITALQDHGEVVWATAWEDLGNSILAPRLGINDLPVVTFYTKTNSFDKSLHWKTLRLVDYADGRPFVWVDDEATEADIEFLSSVCPQPHAVKLIDPRVGLTEADFESLTDLLRSWA